MEAERSRTVRVIAMRTPSILSAAVGVLLFSCLPHAGTGIATLGAQGSGDGEWVPVELSTVGMDGRTGLPIVVLRDPESGSVLPIWIGGAEAQAIALVLHGVVPPRPMTHDLMANLISELRAEVDEVVVTDLRNNTYFGVVRLRVAGEKKIREVDSRPSDALALALRTGAPIRVARKILAAAPEFDFIAPEGPNQVVQALGLTVVAATPSLRKEFRLADRRGVVVTSAFGFAREKGMRRGDLIIEVNGKVIEEPAAFFEVVRATPPRAPVQITYLRDGDTRVIEVPADLPPSKPGRRGRLA
jgi:bifunctional DNase/RNase